MKELKHIQKERRDTTYIVTINKPETLNALNEDLLQEIDSVFDEIAKDDKISCVILTGVGKSFVAGADIKAMSQLNEQEALEFSEYGSRVFRKIELLNKVVIAAVNGYAIGGGCELALACDIRIASSNAIFSQPETSLGIIPGFSGTQRLSRIIGLGFAKEIIFTAKSITAEEAYRYLLVNKVVEQENLINACMEIANKISTKSQFAVSQAKKAINEGVEEHITEGIKLESKLFAKCFSNKDQKEGMSAFVEKRKPNFNNK